MNYKTPLLFRFKRECLSPRRAKPSKDYEYDPVLQMGIIMEDGKRIAAIDSPKCRGLVTKKADIEKSEDQKDSRRWR